MTRLTRNLGLGTWNFELIADLCSLPFYFCLLYNPPRPCPKARSPEDSGHDARRDRTEAQNEKIPSAVGADGARGAHHPGTHTDDGTDTNQQHPRDGRVSAASREEDY